MINMRVSLPLFLSVLSVMFACKRPTDSNAAPVTYRSTLIEGVPHIRQKPDFCGEACAAMFLQKLGVTVDQDYVFDHSAIDPALGRGAYTAELNRALLNIGFDTGKVWAKVSSPLEIEAQFAALHRDLSNGIASIVCMYSTERPDATEHFRLILGYDATSDEVIYHEQAADDGAYLRMKLSRFLSLWPLESAFGNTMIRLRLDPKTVGFGEASAERTGADFAQSVLTLKHTVPSGFTFVVEPPFVVIGDEAPATVQSRAVTTVRRTAALLKKDFFTKDPHEILAIYLFRDSASYRTRSKQLFGRYPDTPYGYFSEKNRALVMNIATGGGTLVHEIVHPFVRANFQDCPAWFNEGLGSLYEACGENDGHIVGYPNWRLSGLQKAIGARTLPSFRHLMETTDAEFYDEDRGTNYAQARYLLYYLQERGLLISYYHAFLKNRREDPTGYGTLKKILGENDMEGFQKHWERWVLGISED